MEEKTLEQQQVEALLELHEYMKKLIPAIESIIPELREARKEDTDEYLKVLIDGMNWSISVINHTVQLINSEDYIIDKELISSKIVDLSKAIRNMDDLAIADLLEKEILPFFLIVNSRAAVLTNSAS